jgi:hypothetical protein
VALLFFTTSVSKFCLVQQDHKSADSLELKRTYYVKNAQKKLNDVFVASSNTVIKMSKKNLDDAQRYFRQMIFCILMMVYSSFSTDEINALNQKIQQEDLDFGQPPPPKRCRIEESLPTSTTISLSKFLSTPHMKTKSLTIEVKIISCVV